MATHSSVLAWRIPGMEEPCGLPSVGSQRVYGSDLAAAAAFTFIKRLFSSLLFAIRVVSSAYLQLLTFLPAILILACASSSPVFLMMYSAAAAKSLQSCSTLCDPVDGSPPGSPIPGILQARTLEWAATSFSNA